MVIDSKYSKKFTSSSLTKLKYNELHNFATYLYNFKNKLSSEINKNIFYYLEVKYADFVKSMREKYNGLIPSSFDRQLYIQVITSYQNKFNLVQQKLTFEKIIFQGFEFYKRNTKYHKKGDFKKVLLQKEKTPLSICLSYLSRYGNKDIVKYIDSQLNIVNENKKVFYLNILKYIDKFGLKRLLDLALSKRNRIIKHYTERPIKFESLAFSGRCRKKDILSYNKNYNSVINSFISLSGLGRNSFDIPIKFNKNWFGNIKDYHKKSNDYEYTITFNEKIKQVNIYLCKDGQRYIPTVDKNSKLIGIDVNIKHNLFSLSDGSTYDYNRKLVSDFCQLSIYLDKVKNKQGKDYKIGKRYQLKLNKLREKMLKSNQYLISCMCKDLQDKGIRHIVMEELDNSFRKTFIKDKNNGNINFNRVINFLRLSNLKNEVEHIARKYNIVVSTVHSYYTSKMCPICGCVDDENRLNQEEFNCIECNHFDNADINAAVNIKNRVSVTVLREKLLKQLDNGAYEPKNLNKEKVKEVLLLYHTRCLKHREPNIY